MTLFSEVYEQFLSRVEDYTFVADDLTQEELEKQLFKYLNTAVSKFYKCRQDLSYNVDKTAFLSNLTQYEIEILLTFMTVEYLRPQIMTTELLRQTLSDKDFKIYSQANQIRELRLLYENFQKEAKKMVMEYTFMKLGDE